jgi:hypothetical protein
MLPAITRFQLYIHLVVAILSSTIPTSHGYETDQLNGRDRELKDCGKPLNAYLGEMLESARLRAESNLSLSDSNEEAAEEFRAQVYALNPFDLQYFGARTEVWMRTELMRQGYGWLPEPNLYSDYSQTLLAPGWNPTVTIPFVFSIARGITGEIISPTFKIRDVRFGADKISHFLRIGYDYWQKSEGGTRDEQAIRLGTASENGRIGMQAIGVFSFADLAANFAGYRFYRNLVGPVGSDRPHFTIVRERSRLRFSKARPFDLSEYASPDWDEYLNPNVYSSHLQVAVTHALERRRCELCQERTRWRSEDRSSNSLMSLDSYVDLDQAPRRVDPYQLETLCAP